MTTPVPVEPLTLQLAVGVTAALVTALAGVVFGLALAAPPGPMNAIIAEESVLRGWGAGFRAGLGAALADVTFFMLAALGVVGFVDRVPTVRGVMVGVGGVLMLYFAYGAVREAELVARLRGRETDAGFLGTGGTTGADDRPDTTDESSTDATGAHADGGSATAGDRRAGSDETRETSAAVTSGETTGTGDRIGGTGFRKAFVLALTNPYQILFWITVGVGLLDPGRIDVFAEAGVAALAGRLVVETGSPALLVGFFGGIGVWITGFPAALVSARRRVERLAPVVAGLSALALAGFGVAFLADAVRVLT